MLLPEVVLCRPTRGRADAMIEDPYVVIRGSDGGAHVAFICQVTYSSHLLGHWVREKRAL